ncbi:serine protease 33-like isoform X1 [Choloepus didactylus]|uniref:serine protease 33-like isoform X1 n=1 Tax=Choloepus didactylus TaxID=27675 RepID=UPI00189E0DE4|nr:serine protease 33-like isoform X1 [Choloepus didactylus]
MSPLLLLLLLGTWPRLAEASLWRGPARWPWQASIFLDSRYRCEGALISQEWVLSGAKCFGSWPRSRFSVTLGPARLSLEAAKVKLAVRKVLLSSGGFGGSQRGHLALAWLERPPALSTAVQPVPLAAWPQTLLPGQLCWAQGFEPDFDPSNPPRSLLSILLKPLPLNTCQAAFRLLPDCPAAEARLPPGAQCTRPHAGPPERVVRAGPGEPREPFAPPQSHPMPPDLAELNWPPCHLPPPHPGGSPSPTPRTQGHPAPPLGSCLHGGSVSHSRVLNDWEPPAYSIISSILPQTNF